MNKVSKNLKFLLIKFILGTAMLMLAEIHANALQVDNIFFIGDSLSDQGNVLPGLITPRTNGNTYAFYLGQLFNKLITPSLFGGTDFARFGASTGIPFLPTVPSFLQVDNGLQQIDELLQNFPHFSKHSLFIYWLGSNDIILSSPIDKKKPAYPTFNAFNSVNNAMFGISKLSAAGAKNLVVLNLPALERTPASLNEKNPFIKAAYYFEPREFNQLLLQRLNDSGMNVIQLDLFSVMNYVLDNFTKFGYTNITSECCPPAPQPCTNPNPACATFLWYDEVHPTDKTHRLIADFIFENLTAPDFVATLAEIPFSLMQSQYASIRQQLYPLMPDREEDKFYPFVSGNFNGGTQNGITVDRTSYDAYGANGTAGLIRLFSPNLAVGGAVGQIISQTNYNTLGSQFNTHGTTLSLFASYQRAKFYINGIVDYARLNYWDIQRRFGIGPVVFSGNGSTTGNQYGTSWQTGYNLKQTDTFQFGPLINFEYQGINVNGYSETGADVFNIIFDNQRNNSLIGGGGLQLTKLFQYRCIPLTTNAFVTLNKQFLGGDRDIFFHQASIAANFASLPVTSTAVVFASTGVNVAATFRNGLIASLGYIFNYGDNQFSSNLVLMGLTMPL